ncbi:MFS transporter [Buchnera aphidicola (Thelaxes californica)]|uniref:MFS transporter n=2 Tax=Buchnera aphidicola TaxID=9 RepID=A0A4D6YPA1_9GAMM|nr:MFS transporter [Buchnera aphidicola (Thelaxes californica)]
MDIKKKKKFIKQTSKDFYKVMVALFLAGFATFSMLYCVQPILPIFSKKFNISPTVSSLSLSSATLMMAVGMLISGALSDTIGRKSIMGTSLLLSSLLTMGSAYTDSWYGVILIRSLIGLSLSGVVGVAMSYLNEEIHPKILGLSMGLYISGNTVGGLVGRIVSSSVTHYLSWNAAFFSVGLCALCSSIVFMLLLPVSKNFSASKVTPVFILNNIICQCKNKYLSTLFIIGFILMGSFITVFNYITYRLMVSPFYLSQVMISYISLVYLIGVYTSPKAGILITQYHSKIILMSSLFMMLIGLLLTQLDIIYFIIIGLLFFSGGFFAAHSVSSSWIGFLATKSKGQASSLYLFFYYLGSSICSIFGGCFWFIGHWIGISLFVMFMLVLGIQLINQLNDEF